MQPFLVSVFASIALAAGSVSFPKEFREWAHVKSATILAGHPAFATDGGQHHIYANPAALIGYRTGNYADGAIIVYELTDIQETNGVVNEGARKRVDVMVRDAKRFASTGGWGFGRFMGTNQTEQMLDEKGAAACFACHGRQTAKSFVFSAFRE